MSSSNRLQAGLTSWQGAALWPLRKAFSRPATRAYISGILFLVASIILLALALVSYVLFYASEVPQVNVEREVHLQFG
jgi:uncharacterized protein (DUF58 family)